MTDSELLSFAAKAIGITDGDTWNPLRNSGECFEMAYKSGVDICFFDRYDTIEEFRRAIVEAVAKIGERMINA